MKKLYLALVFSVALGFAGGACAADLVVSAAASLTNAFTEIGKAYEKARPGNKVVFNFAGSGQLLQQIARGAPVDVFASADQETMDRAAKQNLIWKNSRQDFVRNKLVVVVPGDSQVKVNGLDDLRGVDVKRIAVANPDSVPVGRYAKQALQAGGLWDALKEKYISTTNVRQSLDYVARGEVDAGFVYVTDALLMPNRVRNAFDVPLGEPILYPVALVKGNGNEAAARAFIEFLNEGEARRVLDKYGFGQP